MSIAPDIIRAYEWTKPLHELTAPDIVEFRSWLLKNHSRVVAQKALLSLRSMVRELMTRGILAHDFASGDHGSDQLALRRARDDTDRD